MNVVEYTPAEKDGRWDNGDYLEKLNSLQNVQFSLRTDSAADIYDAQEMLAQVGDYFATTAVQKAALTNYKAAYEEYAGCRRRSPAKAS